MATHYVGSDIEFPGGTSVQALVGSGERVNATAEATGSAPAELPGDPDATVYIVRAEASIWLALGESDMDPADATADSILFVGGEGVVAKPAGATHFSVARVGGDDVVVQIEQAR